MIQDKNIQQKKKKKIECIKFPWHNYGMNILRQINPTFAVPVADGSVFYFLGVRQEQDLFVRLIDSVTKQVPRHRPCIFNYFIIDCILS